jgi:RNA polymerase sigma factor (sigma-70 family)
MSHESSQIESLEQTSTAALVSAGSAGALQEQFDRILREYGAALSRLAASYEPTVGNREELVQDIALAIWKGIPHFRGECSERTYVYRIAHNRALSHVWKRRPSHQPLEELRESQHPIDPRPHPEEETALKDQRAKLLSAIHSLPIAYRQMIQLLLEDLSHAEIAEILGITENNVAVRLNRARKALKDALGTKP